MIKVKKTILNEIFFFCILIAIVIAPSTLLDLNNTQLIDVPNITELSLKEISDEPATAQNHNAFQRLRTTKTALTKTTDALVEHSLPVELTNQLVNTVEKQLLTLQNFNALPELTFSDEPNVIVSKRSYIDMKDPHNSINIWGIQINYSELFVNAYLDIDTSMLCEVSITAKANDLNYDPEDISSNGFLEYLKMTSESVEYDGEQFYAMGSYTEDTIRLFTVSHNHITKAFTEYTFEEDDNYATIVRPEFTIYEPTSIEQH